LFIHHNLIDFEKKYQDSLFRHSGVEHFAFKYSSPRLDNDSSDEKCNYSTAIGASNQFDKNEGVTIINILILLILFNV